MSGWRTAAFGVVAGLAILAAVNVGGARAVALDEVPEKPGVRGTSSSQIELLCEIQKVNILETVVTQDWVLVDNVWVEAEPVVVENLYHRDANPAECPATPVPPVVEPVAPAEPVAVAPAVPAPVRAEPVPVAPGLPETL